MIGAVLRIIRRACTPETVKPVSSPVVTVKSYTRKRPLSDKKAETHARLRQELGRLA